MQKLRRQGGKTPSTAETVFTQKSTFPKNGRRIYEKSADTALIADIVRRSGYEVLGVETIEGER